MYCPQLRPAQGSFTPHHMEPSQTASGLLTALSLDPWVHRAAVEDLGAVEAPVAVAVAVAVAASNGLGCSQTCRVVKFLEGFAHLEVLKGPTF